MATQKTEVTAASHLGDRRLTQAQFRSLAEMPAEGEWFANLKSPQTRRAYSVDIKDFMKFTGIRQPPEFRQVTRAHCIAWRDHLDSLRLAPSTIRRKLAALASLFDYLCEKNAVMNNPVNGVKRPRVETYEGKTPALSDQDAAFLLETPDVRTIKGARDRAILSTLLYQGPRREEVAKLRVKDMHMNRGFMQFEFRGKGGKTRYVPVSPHTATAIHDYLMEAGHKADAEGPLFRPVQRRSNSVGGLTADAIYKIVKAYLYGVIDGVDYRLGPHALRATAATNALDHNADIAKVQEWLGHSSIATTRVYDRRRNRPEDSPTFKVAY